MRRLQESNLRHYQEEYVTSNLPTSPENTPAENAVPLLLGDQDREDGEHSRQDIQPNKQATARPDVREVQRRVASSPLVDPVVE